MTRPTFVLAVCVTLAGCSTPEIRGVLAATATGNLLSPPASRTDPLAAVAAACGEPEAPSDGIARHPYVQSVSTDRAIVTWTSTAPERERLQVWIAGTDPRELAATDDETRYLTGATQRSVRLDGLAPGTLHCYALLDATGRRAYGPYGFRTAPAGGDRVDLAILGDSGGATDDQRAVAAQLRTVPIELLLHVGDVAYNNGTIEDYETKHFAIYDTTTSVVPLFPAIGDHDDASDRSGPYREVFALPENGADERYYSFDWGPLHVVVMDVIGGGTAQIDWLERDLAATTQPWRIVVVHLPPFSSGWHGSAAGVRQDYVPIFERHGVQLVVSGDDHDYERTIPISGVTYVVTGGGGASVRPVGRSEWTAFSETVFHITYVSIDGDVMRVRAIDATGREFDGVEIRR